MSNRPDWELCMNATSVAELHALAQAIFRLSFQPQEDERLESRVRMACNPMMDGDAGPAFTSSHGAALNFISQLLSLRADELDRLRPSYCAEKDIAA